jgi:hypothetical protein
VSASFPISDFDLAFDEFGEVVTVPGVALMQTLYVTGDRIATVTVDPFGGTAVDGAANTPAGTHDGNVATADRIVGSGLAGHLDITHRLAVGWRLDPIVVPGPIDHLRYRMTASMPAAVALAQGVVHGSTDRGSGFGALALADGQSGTLDVDTATAPGGGAWTTAGVAEHVHGFLLELNPNGSGSEVLRVSEFYVEVYGVPTLQAIVNRTGEKVLDGTATAAIAQRVEVSVKTRELRPGFGNGTAVTVSGTAYVVDMLRQVGDGAVSTFLCAEG